MLTVNFHRIELETRIGIYDWEQDKDQTLYISLSLRLRNQSSVSSDAIEDTVDYESIQNLVVEHIGSRSFGLIEKVAYEVYQLLIEHPLIETLEVTVEKPGALSATQMVSVIYTGD